MTSTPEDAAPLKIGDRVVYDRTGHAPDTRIPTESTVIGIIRDNFGWHARIKFDATREEIEDGLDEPSIVVDASKLRPIPGKVSIDITPTIPPGFTQRMLPELIEDLYAQARWVKSMPPRAAAAMESAAAELDELVTLRRLHEEATSRSATFRTALESIVEAEDDRRQGEGALKLFDRIADARKLLDSKGEWSAVRDDLDKPLRWTIAADSTATVISPPGHIGIIPPGSLDPRRFESTDYYRAKRHKAADDLIAALAEARGETSGDDAECVCDFPDVAHSLGCPRHPRNRANR